MDRDEQSVGKFVVTPYDDAKGYAIRNDLWIL